MIKWFFEKILAIVVRTCRGDPINYVNSFSVKANYFICLQILFSYFLVQFYLMLFLTGSQKEGEFILLMCDEMSMSNFNDLFETNFYKGIIGRIMTVLDNKAYKLDIRSLEFCCTIFFYFIGISIFRFCPFICYVLYFKTNAVKVVS